MYGGRGSAKSHSVARALVLRATQKPLRILCTREVQKTIKDSVKKLIDDVIFEYGLTKDFVSTETEIRGTNGSSFIFAGMRSNPQNIKSMEGIDLAWCEEASSISQKSLELLIPTIRAEKSEIWFTWNPENELDPVDLMFRGRTPPPGSIIRQTSWRDNPWFPDVLRKEMEFDKAVNLEKYLHVWEGGYNVIQQGAYYAKQISQAIAENRVTKVPYDPAAPVYVAFDLGISDATALWFFQFIGMEVRVIDFLQNTGEAIGWYAQEMQKKGYVYADVVLPHDGRARQLGTGKSIEEVLRGFGFNVVICPSISVKDGIEAVRAFLMRCWFDQEKCATDYEMNGQKIPSGLRHLQSYRENYDEKLRISRGPLHDEHSHAADSFRMAAVAFQNPRLALERQQAMLSAAQQYVEKLQAGGRPQTVQQVWKSHISKNLPSF